MSALLDITKAQHKIEQARTARTMAIVYARDVDHETWRAIAEASGMTIQGVIRIYKIEKENNA